MLFNEHFWLANFTMNFWHVFDILVLFRLFLSLRGINVLKVANALNYSNRLWAQDVKRMLYVKVIVILPKRMAEMSVSEITKIEKFNGRNYQSWKCNVKLVLMKRGFLGFGSRRPTNSSCSWCICKECLSPSISSKFRHGSTAIFP